VIVDASVLVAIALREPGYEALQAQIDQARELGVGAPTLVETGLVLSAKTGRDAAAAVAHVVAGSHAAVVDFGDAHWREALAAWTRFGKGRHPARLNFGDCLSYATARVAGQPLLALGGDFAKTDIELA
jgi:ribonuclease VapC